MAAIDIGVKFSIQKLDEIVGGFNKLIEGLDFGKGFELDAQTIKAQFDIVKDQLGKALQTGELDVNSLNLPGLVRSLEGIAKQAAKAMGSELNDKALEPFKAELDTIGGEIDKKANKLKDITSERRSISEEAVKKQTKEETGGGVSRVMFGSMAEAQGYLQKLKEAEKEDPGASQKRTELINFYQAYVKNLKKAEKARADLNKEEEKIKGEIGKLKAKEEALLLKIKKESAGLDAQTPANIKNILALTTQLREVYEKLRKTQKAGNDEKKKEIEGSKESTNANNNEAKSFASKAISAGIYYTAINAVKRLMRESVQVVKELDKAMTDAAIVTDMNRQEAWKLLGTYQDLAKTTGLAVAEISGVVVEFLKQGRTLKEALELAEVAAKAAKVAGISANDAVNYLTAAVNGFGLAAKDAVDIADKFSAIAAASASDFEELAIAMSKVAPVAKTAGVGVDFMMGVLAKGLETTREAPENIGTAFKTIFARMREVTDIGKATEDGMSLNRVEKALASINVPLRDVSGQFRNLEDVLIDVGDKWDTLTSIEQAYIATSLAGTRQQPRLLAIFNDFARTKELIELSSDSVGALQFQHIDYMDGMEAAMNRLQNSWQGFIMVLTDSDIIIGLIGGVTTAIEILSDVFQGLSDSAGYTKVIIGLIIAALSIMAAKTLMNTKIIIMDTFSQILNNAAKAAGHKAAVAASAAKLAEAKATLMATKATIANTAATAAAGATAKTASVGFIILAKAVLAALWPLLLVAVAIAAFIGVAILITNAVIDAGRGAEYFGQEIDKVNKKLNDLENKEKNIEKLSKRFQELQKITNKTAGDIEEMSTIAEELNSAELTVGGETKTYDFATVDFTGAAAFNIKEYNRFLEDAKNERERLNAEASKNFAEALKRDGVDAFKDNSISNYARKQGYDAGVAFADSMGTAISNETKTKVKKQLGDSLKTMDMSIFYTMRYRTSDGKEFDTAKERDEYVAQQRGLGNKITALRSYDSLSFDEAGLEEFTKKLTGIYIKGSQFLEKELKDINENENLTQIEKTKKTLEATVSAYTQQINEARRTLTGEELRVALSLIGQNNVDGAILNTLINERRIETDLIVNLTLSGMSAEQIENYLGSFEVPGFARRCGMTDEQFQAQKDTKLTGVRSSIERATSGGAANITAGFASFRQELKDLGYTPAQIEAEVKKLGQVVQTLSTEQVGNLIQSQSELTKKAMDLSSKISKGDFSDFGEVVSEYGIEAATNILNGSEAGIRSVMEKNRQKTMGEIASSIAEIYAVEGVSSFSELSKAAQEQVKSLELMRDYYDDIVGFEMLREFRMKQITGYMKEMNDLLKLQESLMNLGMAGDSPFIETLDLMVDSLDRLARTKIDKQLEDDLKNLEKFGKFINGQFVVNPDINIAQADQAIEAAMSTLTTYVQMQTEAFNRQKKAIEEASKAEIDAAKKSFDEKWRSIEYTDKLAEAENKIFEARRKVAAFSISGIGKGQAAEAQSELKSAEQERRKTIEQEGLREVEKELEIQRNEAIVLAQQTMTLAIEEYTAELSRVLPPLTQTLENLIIAMDKDTKAVEADTKAVIANTEVIVKDTGEQMIKIKPNKPGVEFLGPMM
jgi:TP901 family phage tail tape measure protein